MRGESFERESARGEELDGLRHTPGQRLPSQWSRRDEESRTGADLGAPRPAFRRTQRSCRRGYEHRQQPCGMISPALTPWLAERIGWSSALSLTAGLAVMAALLWLGIRVNNPQVSDLL